MSSNTPANTEPETTAWFNAKTYDATKFVAQILLPALATLYAAVAGIWNAPDAEAVVATIVAIDTFLGVLLGISSAQYAAATPATHGTLNVVGTPEGTMLSLSPDIHPDAMVDKKTVTFAVNPVTVHDEDPTTPGVVPPVNPPTA